jgi:hypothetical protein
MALFFKRPVLERERGRARVWCPSHQVMGMVFSSRRMTMSSAVH